MSHLLENNSTNKPLLANEVFLGSPVLIDSSQITASVSFSTDTDAPGQLEFLHSQNGKDFFNFEDIFQYYGASHNRQVSLKGLYIRVRYTNGPINQTSFLLFTRLLTTQNDDMNVNVNYQHDSILCYANEGGFDIRSLTSNLDSVSVPAIEACITGTSLNVNITNQSGLNNVNLFDGYGNPISSNEGALNVNASITVPHLNYTTDSVSIGGTLPALTFAHDAVNVSGSSVSVSGSVSVSNQLSNYATASNQISTNTKLDTINTTINNKTSNGLNDSIQIYGSNGITNKPFLMDNYQSLNVNPIDDSINDAPFDLLINGSTLWADSTPLGNPFFADLNGRQGWYYDNFNNIANTSNIYWYANPVSGSLKENNMAFSSLGSMYAIITCDYVENGELTVPFMGVYSQATGTNDFIPGFAHSRWVFQLNGDNRAKLRKGETILIYTGSTRPNYHINLPAYPLSLASQNGDCSPLEIIAYMTINTQATTSKIGYLLQYCGYMNSLIGFNREYEFRNSKDRLIQNNLSASRILVDTGLTSLNVDIGITNIAINNFSELNGLTVDTGLTSIFINNSSLNVDTGLTSIFVNNFSELNGLTVDTGLTSIFINNTSINVDTGLTNLAINNFSELNGLNVDTGLTSIFINNTSLNVDTGLTNLAINNFSELNGLTVDTGLTSIFVNNQSLTVETGLTSIFVNNQINNYALETGGNLASIKANSDKFVFSGNNLNTVVANFPSQQNVWVDNQISGYAMETGGNLASIASNTSTTNTKIDGTNTRLDTVNNNLVYINSGLTTINNTITNKHLSSTNDSVSAQISNTSLDVHCYASSNSTDWHHLKSDANGVLNVHSMLQDGAGNDLTSTAIGSTRNLDTIATLYANNSGTKSAITSTNGSLNANITNSSIAVSGTVNIGNTVSVNANITNSTIATTQSASTSNTTINAVDWINTTTSQLACSRPVLGFLPNAGPMSLETRAFNRTYNPSDNAWNEMTSTTTSSGHYSLDCNLDGINRTSNALNTYSTNPTTTNFYNRTGISMYPIYPKKRILPWGGKNTTASANTMLGAPGGTLTYGNAFGIGIPRTHYIYLTASSGSGRIFYYSYVSSTDGTIKNGQITLSLNTWQTLAQTDIACMRAIRGITTAISGSDNLRIAVNSASVANSYWYWDAYNYNPGVYVCPANCLAYVSNITFYASSGTDVALYINKNDGTEDTAFWYGQIIHQFFNASNFNTSAGSEGAIGGYVYPGQCIYWFSLNPTPNDKRICFPIVEYFDL